MDELTRWQLKEIAREAEVASAWLKSSGTLAVMRLSRELQVLHDAGFFAQLEQTVAVIKTIEKSAVGEILRFQANYAEAIAVLIGLHRQFDGIGTTFTLTSDERGSSDEVVQERHLILPAEHKLALGGELRTSSDLQIEVIRGSASSAQEDNTSSATGRTVEGSVSLVGTSSFTARGTVVNFSSGWTIERSENSSGQHQFILRTDGSSERQRRKIDFIADFAQCVMRDDEVGKGRVLSSFLASTNDGTAATQEQEPQRTESATTPSEESSSDVPDLANDVSVFWKKRFSDSQLRTARSKLPLDVCLPTVESALAQIQRQTNGSLRYQHFEGLSQIRFTLTIGRKKGLDIIIGRAVPGLPGLGHYSYSSRQEGRLWRTASVEFMKWVSRELDNQAAIALINEYGADAFEDTPLVAELNNQPANILQITVGRPSRLMEAVSSLLDFYGEIKTTNLLLLERESRSNPLMTEQNRAEVKTLSQDEANNWKPKRFVVSPILPGQDFYQVMADANGVTREVVEGYYASMGVVAASAPPPRKGGRPTKQLYDWAYEQIREGRPQNEVYLEWLTQMGQAADTLADAQDCFKHAMKARKEKEGGRKGKK